MNSKTSAQKQYETDLKANEDASDKLDKELNKNFKPELTVETKTPKQRILKEYGGLESNIPLFHHYWQLK